MPTKDQRDTLTEIRRAAEGKGFSVRVEPGRGKGGHLRVYVGDRASVIPSKVGTILRKAILKQLGLS